MQKKKNKRQLKVVSRLYLNRKKKTLTKQTSKY